MSTGIKHFDCLKCGRSLTVLPKDQNYKIVLPCPDCHGEYYATADDQKPAPETGRKRGMSTAPETDREDKIVAAMTAAMNLAMGTRDDIGWGLDYTSEARRFRSAYLAMKEAEKEIGE